VYKQLIIYQVSIVIKYKKLINLLWWYVFPLSKKRLTE